MSAYNFLVHLLFPRESNNQKAKLLHSSTLIIISLLLVFYQAFLHFLPSSGLKILGYASSISLDEVLRLTNEKRVQAGLSSLELNPQLSEAAKNKGNDMITRDYWAHVAPDGTQPWKFFTDVGYKYRYAGENLARDFSNAPSAIDAWMASPTHKENILSPKYQEIGLAVVEGDLNGVDTTIIVQLFGTKMSGSPQTLPVAKAQEKTAALVSQKPQASAQSLPLATPAPQIAQTSPLATPTNGEYLQANLSALNEKLPQGTSKVLVSPFTSTRRISLFVVGFLLVVLVVDASIASKRRIARIGGRTFAHISFLGMILTIAIILKAGQIL
jgi:uncharacterized protein YkwD